MTLEDVLCPNMQRVLDERNELLDKIAVLDAIAEATDYVKLIPEYERIALCDQRRIMYDYVEILRTRITRSIFSKLLPIPGACPPALIKPGQR